MSLWKKIKGGVNKVLGIALVSLLLSQAIAPAFSVKAAEPRFNFLEDDLPIIRGANKSAGEKDWHKPVQGKAGDTFAGIVYYHNGVPGTTAHNTKVKVNLPAQTTNGKIVVGASVSAENAAEVSGSMTFELGEDALVSIVPDSVKWFPNFRSNETPAQPLLDGQSGAELFGHGLNIGPINGCWDFIGYVVFQFKTSEIPHSHITKSKIAKNIMTGEEGVDITANPSDEVIYTLTTKNIGSLATDYIVEDDISDILELADFKEASLGGTVSNGIIRYPAVRIVPGETVVRTFKVIVKDPQPTNAQNGKHFDGVMENCYGNWVFVRIFKPGKPCLKIEKLVRNVTINEQNFVKENQAKSGDILEYKISFSNTGERAENLTVSDVIPANTSYIAGSTVLIKGGQTINPGDKIATDGIAISSLSKGETGVIKFRVKIASGIADGECLLNTATLWFNKQALTDTAKTRIVEKPVPVTPNLPMTGPETPILSLLFVSSGALLRRYFKAKKALSLLKSDK